MTPPGRLVVVTGLPGSGKTTLATALAASLPAVRMCPDDWMLAAGFDLWDAGARTRIEGFQGELTVDLLAAGRNVVIEWGTWSRRERDELRDAARSVGAAVELRPVSASVDELWRRIVARDREGRSASRLIRRTELEGWFERYESPTTDELGTYDPPFGGCPGGRGGATRRLGYRRRRVAAARELVRQDVQVSQVLAAMAARAGMA